jgi:hypothetical protein
MKISGYGRHPKKCDDSTESFSMSGVPNIFQQWQHHWAKCIAAQEGYFKGDPSYKL